MEWSQYIEYIYMEWGLYFCLADLGELLPGDEAVPVLVKELEGGVGLAGPVAPSGALRPAHHLHLGAGVRDRGTSAGGYKCLA